MESEEKILKTLTCPTSHKMWNDKRHLIKHKTGQLLPRFTLVPNKTHLLLSKETKLINHNSK